MKRHLTQFALVLLLPLIFLSGFFLWLLVVQERTRIENQTLDVTQALSITIDREIYGLQRAAEIISYSNILKNGRFDILQTTLRDMAAELNIVMTIYDPEAKLLVSSDTAHIADIPLLTKADLQNVSPEKPTYVSGLMRAGQEDPYYFTVLRPVLVEGRVQYYLALTMEAQRISDILNMRDIHKNWTAFVVDENDRVLARSSNSKDYTGKLIPDNLRAVTRDAEGFWSGKILDGNEVFGYYIRSDLSGWRTAIGVNRAELNRPVWLAFAYFVLLLVGTVLLSVVLAGFFGRRISRPVRKLAAQAKAVGDVPAVKPLKSGIVELDVVSDALAEADKRNRSKELRLLEAQLRLQMALDAGNIGVWEYSPDDAGVTLDGRASHMLAFEDRHKINFDTDFMPLVHDEDRTRVETAMGKALQSGEIVRETFRIRDEDQPHPLWVTGIGRRIYTDSGKPSVLGLLVNVTAEQMALQQREVVAQELNHRLKNMFAVIISLMNLSARGKTDVQDYVRQMRERMTALASAFTLTYQNNTTALSPQTHISLNELLSRLAEPYGFADQERIRITGEALLCPVGHVTPISLVFHELVTNAVKHGALSVPQGHVEIRLSKQAPFMTIEWLEIHGPEITQEPLTRGFGSRLKQMSIDVQMQGSFKEVWAKEGLICIIQLPLPDLTDLAEQKSGQESGQEQG
ncbi:sensor histidine kinase [Pseudochrobactrum kiredjianiae]|uniref:histidine kinase n=1 Tax=Pseudochrobactrum kiredjianiae TaxID=386305 RepID=A0ABW3V8M9_9HYPH|nr:HWE histidine kinase domain-containing protein [Pseudochrobactrum kiredjianiae]MDM7849871.1 HWE histidine kinase domain-containing protein [Pseudochrobactrum kiredjianiae]